MRLSVLSLLLLAAALAGGLALPATAPNAEYLLDGDYIDCDLIKRVFCSRANWLSDRAMFRTWQVVPDRIEEDGDLHEHFESVEYSEQWQHLELQTRPRRFDDVEGRASADIRFNDPDLSGLMMIYLQNKDVLIENEMAYFVYDSIIASTNPFNMQKVTLTCFHKYMTQTTQNDRLTPDDKDTQVGEIDINGKNANVEMLADFQKRQDSEIGQTEIPDVLFFNEDQNGDIKKKLFSFWSRLQGLSPRARTLPARRHAFVYYGAEGGPLSAEPRAARPRPPGQPLRWG